MAILVPGFAADDQDIMAIFWDASANEVSRYVHDDSGNSWAETSIAGTMVEQNAATAYPHFDAAVDLANSQIVITAWSAVDAANADLRCWTVSESAITETAANVVLNGTDDQGLCAVGIDTSTGHWYVAYGGKSDGSETFASGGALPAINLYFKASTDGGATWSPETLLTNVQADIRWINTVPRMSSRRAFLVAYHRNSNPLSMIVNAPLTASARANFQLGVA
jgi:hypothetical protein